MSSTVFAYSVVGVRIPTSVLFTAGESSMECGSHGVSSGPGKFCSHCGREMYLRWEQIPTPIMVRAGKFYNQEPLALWHLMTEKKDEENNDAPLGVWRTEYGHDVFTDEDEVIVGLGLVSTPFVGHCDYPVADISLADTLTLSATVEEHLKHLGITAAPRLFVVAYYS